MLGKLFLFVLLPVQCLINKVLVPAGVSDKS